MPNWCSNNLYIKGDEAEIKRFVDEVTLPKNPEVPFTEYSIIHKLYPCPTELAETVKGFYANNEDGTKSEKQIAMELQQEKNLVKYGYETWWDWCVEKWGTKWGDHDTDVLYADSNFLEIYFQSAWSPPTEAFKYISTLFPTLTFVLGYQEQGCGFVGACAYRNGNSFESYSEDITIPETTQDEDSPDYWDIVTEAYNDEQHKCHTEVLEWLQDLDANTPAQ